MAAEQRIPEEKAQDQSGPGPNALGPATGHGENSCYRLAGGIFSALTQNQGNDFAMAAQGIEFRSVRDSQTGSLDCRENGR